jgi:transposase
VRYYEFVRVSYKLKLTISQINGLRSFIEKTDDKREYRRAVAVFQKADGKTYDYIAREHRVHIRTTKKWIGDYIKKGIEGLKISKNHGGRKPRITDESREIILSVLFNDPHIFGYLRNKWSLRSLARCLTDALDIQISFKHLQPITRDLGVRCKRPKLELLHDGKDYEEGKERVENYKHVATALKKRSDVII